MIKKITVFSIFFLMFFPIFLFSQSSIECEKENQQLKKINYKLENDNTRLRSQLKNIEKGGCDTINLMSQISDLKDKVSNLTNDVNNKRDSIYLLNISINKIESQININQDSISNIKKIISLLQLEIDRKNKIIDSLTSMSDDEKKQWIELELSKIHNKQEEVSIRNKRSLDSINLENNKNIFLQEERIQQEKEQQEKDLIKDKHVKEDERRAEMAVAESLRVEKELELSVARSKLPDHFCFGIGGGLGWSYGSLEQKQISFAINFFAINLIFGYWIDEPCYDSKGTLIGVFSEIGSSSENSLKNNFYINPTLKIKSINPYYEFYIGTVVNEVFIFTIGYGKQEIYISGIENQISSKQYFCSNLGFYYPITKFWDLGLKSTFMIGYDYKKLSAKFELGSNINLSFVKW